MRIGQNNLIRQRELYENLNAYNFTDECSNQITFIASMIVLAVLDVYETNYYYTHCISYGIDWSVDIGCLR